MKGYLWSCPRSDRRPAATPVLTLSTKAGIGRRKQQNNKKWVSEY